MTTQFAFGAFAPTTTNPFLATPEPTGDDIQYAPAEFNDANFDGISMLTRALFLRDALTPGDPIAKTWGPNMKWTDWVQCCNYMGTLGTRGAKDTETGEFDPTQFDLLATMKVDDILNSLRPIKRTATQDFSDLTLVLKAEAAKVTYAAEGDHATLKLNGCGHVLKVSLAGDKLGRVIENGDFVARFLHSYSGSRLKHRYVTISQDARDHARLLFSNTIITYPGGVHKNLTIVPRPALRNAAEKYHSMPTDPTCNWFGTLIKIYKEAHGFVANRPMGIGHSSEPLAYMEWVFHHYYLGLADNPAFQKMCDTISEDIGRTEDKVLEQLGPIAKGTVSQGMVTSMVSPLSFTHPAIQDKFVTYGHMSEYVNISRTQVRQGRDVHRKTDAYGIVPGGGAFASVCEKIAAVLNTAHSMKINVTKTEAVGTHVKNHWETIITEKLGSKDVTYCDKDKKFAPVSGAKFQSMDVTNLPPGSKKGVFLLDDSLDIPNSFADGTDPHHVKEWAKVESIIKADYSACAVKLYVTNVDDRATPLNKLPKSLLMLHEKYNQISLVNGGTQHTPEYYAVCNNSAENWEPPVLSPGPKGGVVYQPVGNPKRTASKAERESYMCTWMAIKLTEMFRANVWLNAQVIHGIRFQEPIASLLRLPGTESMVSNEREAYLSGQVPDCGTTLTTAPTYSFGAMLEATAPTVPAVPAAPALNFGLFGDATPTGNAIPGPPTPVLPGGKTIVVADGAAGAPDPPPPHRRRVREVSK